MFSPSLAAHADQGPRSGYRGSDLVVCPACSFAWGWKSPVRPDGGEGRV